MIADLHTLYDYLESHDCHNEVIFNSFVKAHKYINEHNKIFVSISGGSDSDIILDMCHTIDPNNEKCKYWFLDTGLEYNATKEHLSYLEKRYDITIQRESTIKSIPTCCKEYGQPFLSKHASEIIGRLQKHNFEWKDLPYEELLKQYPNCVEGVKWWCNKYMQVEKYGKDRSRFNINFNRWLKEFLIENPPTFKISAECCEYAKKKVAKKAYSRDNYDMSIIGVRKTEGGIRATAYGSCYTKADSGNMDHFRPIFWFMDKDKAEYVEKFDIKHSDCYEVWGFPRTGCVCCPYGNKDLQNELDITLKYEPKMYKAVNNIFKESYEYTQKWLKYKMEKKWADKTGIRRLF